MNSRILHGQTSHCRFLPRRHAFRYRMVWLCMDVDELASLNQKVALLGHNRVALLSLRDADYGGPGAGSVRQKVESLLRRDGVTEAVGRMMLITLPRVLGYAFNPVSFFICYRSDGSLAAMVSEVRNTVGEGHHYVLRPENIGAGDDVPVRFRCSKAFYVSPFLQVRGEYQVQFSYRKECLLLEIHLRYGQQLIFSSDMIGHATPLSTRSLAASACHLVWIGTTVMARITWQALRLYLQKRLPVYAKPEPQSAATYRPAQISTWHRLRKQTIRYVSRRRPTAPADALLAIPKDNP